MVKVARCQNFLLRLLQADHQHRHRRLGRNRRRDLVDLLQSIKFVDLVITEPDVFPKKLDRPNLFDEKFECPKIFHRGQAGPVRKRRPGQRVLRQEADLREGRSNKSAKKFENIESHRDRHQQVVVGQLRLQPPQLGLGVLLRDNRFFVRKSGPSKKFEIRRFVQIRFHVALLRLPENALKGESDFKISIFICVCERS